MRDLGPELEELLVLLVLDVVAEDGLELGDQPVELGRVAVDTLQRPFRLDFLVLLGVMLDGLVAVLVLVEYILHDHSLSPPHISLIYIIIFR